METLVGVYSWAVVACHNGGRETEESLMGVAELL